MEHFLDKTMKKNILSLALLSLLIVPLLVLAQEPPATVDLPGTLDNIVNWVFGILVIFAALMLVWAGFIFVTAGGDATKVSGAREKVLYALIGIIVAFASRGLVALVQTLVQ